MIAAVFLEPKQAITGYGFEREWSVLSRREGKDSDPPFEFRKETKFGKIRKAIYRNVVILALETQLNTTCHG